MSKITENYRDKLEQGLQFQDYVVANLARVGIIIMAYSSQKYQYNKGESFSRHEIKLDMNMKGTGNLFIETAEKRDIYSTTWVPSGIMAKDNALYYIIGDENKVYMFSKKILRRLLNTKYSNKMDIETGTSKGFLIPCDTAEKYADVIDFNENKIT